MIRLKILDIKGDKYLLKDIANKKAYIFNITFYRLEKMPNIGDIFFIHKELLDPKYEEYSTTYQFGPLNEKYGREITNSKHIDFMGAIIDNKKIYLKRFFG